MKDELKEKGIKVGNKVKLRRGTIDTITYIDFNYSDGFPIILLSGRTYTRNGFHLLSCISEYDIVDWNYKEPEDTVENPNKELDKLDDDLINEMEDYEHQKPIQYQIGIDTFQRAKANLTKDELIACIKFNIDKYNWRKKGQDVEDFKKIIDYANFAIEVLKGEK